MSTSGNSRRDALRRYPALAFLIAAGALALLLPSGLTIPSSGPPTLAEYAPVPGQGKGQGNLAELGQGSSGGLGFGQGAGGEGGLVSPPPLLSRPVQPHARLKRCVGKPPRQAEDPLSPPCVAFFDGDNGGATARGVTRDEIRVVLHISTASNPSSIWIDYDDPNSASSDTSDATLSPYVRAFSRFFNDRYQVYQRHIHFYGYHGTGGDAAGLRADALEVQQHANPFAVVDLETSFGTEFARASAERQMLTAVYQGMDGAVQARSAPHLISYAPDLQGQAQISGSYACRKLAGHNARWSGNIPDRTTIRKFGVLWYDDPAAPDTKVAKDNFEAVLGQCGVTNVSDASTSPGAAGSAGAPEQAMVKMRGDGVTTLALFTTNPGIPIFWGQAASNQSYYPEVLIPGSSTTGGMDQNVTARNYQPTFWANAFGVSYDYRRGPAPQQYWYQAYQEGCPSCGAPPSDVRVSNLYDTFTLLLWGIQAAGPRLTAANVDKGLHAIPQRSSSDPFLPAAYFSASDHSWVKDAMEIWWDPAGQEPGTNTPECYRLANQGSRFRAGEWHQDDGEIHTSGAPCQGPVSN